MAAIKLFEHFFVPLADGARLAARLWRPNDAEQKPVPAILEYIPYRKRDGTRARDEPMHGWFAAHGYAAIRVDMRGSGESDGHMADEYLERELEDACEVIAWLSKQPWCDGNVGMMGKSWGGFNALQTAALRPPALKAIITVCSTDDRYADDIHYMGGALLNDNLWWGAIMLPGFVARPSAPRRLLAARLGLRGFRRDPMSRLRGRRLGRRLHERHSAPVGGAERTPSWPDRPLGACLSSGRFARTGDRFSSRGAALVGSLAEER
jgi:predicted acyl esterase